MTFTPYSKDQSVGSRKKAILYKCSDGTEVSEAQIKTKLSKSYKEAPVSALCECCGTEPPDDHDHTIAKARCKVLHKTELIWFAPNWSDSCRTCHGQYESYKSGEFAQHLNVIERMLFMKRHDIEGFKKRLQYIDDESVKKILQNG